MDAFDFEEKPLKGYRGRIDIVLQLLLQGEISRSCARERIETLFEGNAVGDRIPLKKLDWNYGSDGPEIPNGLDIPEKLDTSLENEEIHDDLYRTFDEFVERHEQELESKIMRRLYAIYPSRLANIQIRNEEGFTDEFKQFVADEHILIERNGDFVKVHCKRECKPFCRYEDMFQ